MDTNKSNLGVVVDDDATVDLLGTAKASQPADGVETDPMPSASARFDCQSGAPAQLVPGATVAIPGAVLRGRYVLEQALGAGGTSVVFRARDLRRDAGVSGGRRVALKILRPERREQPQAIERLRREFQYVQTLSHPNIARVFDLDRDGGLWFLTFELLEGESLAALLRRCDNDPLPPRRAIEILRACGEALAHAHERGVVHGDFKPGNIFLACNGQVRILNFGAASASWRLGATPMPSATLAYASPQVLEGERPERRDDVFSFACVAYELLNGRHPFGRRSSREARAARAGLARAWNLSTGQWHMLEAALAWDRNERPAGIRPLLAALTSADVSAPLVIPEIEARARTFRAPVLAPVGAAVLLATLGLVFLVAHSQLHERPDGAPTAQDAAPAAQVTAGAPPGEQPGFAPRPPATSARDSVTPSASPAFGAASAGASREGDSHSKRAASESSRSKTSAPVPELPP